MHSLTAYDLLCRGIRDSDIATVEAALASGADPNRLDEYGNTLLCETFFCEDLSIRHEILRCLLAVGADPNMLEGPDDIGDLHGVLSDAVMRQDCVAVELLLANGADPNLERAFRESLYDFAESDYRYEEGLLSVPDDPPTEADYATPDSFLLWLERIAAKCGRRPPDYVRALRAAGAKTTKEIEQDAQLSKNSGRPEHSPSRSSATRGMLRAENSDILKKFLRRSQR